MNIGTRKLERKLRGKQYIRRDRHMLALEVKMSDPEFRLLEILRDLSDWDKKHTDTYSTFDVANSDIAPLLGWSPSKVSRARKQLICKKLIVLRSNGYFGVFDYADEEGSLPEAIFLGASKVNELVAVVDPVIAKLHHHIAPVHDKRSYDGNSSLVSFKGDSVLLVPCKKYLELEKSGRFGNFTAEDMEFVEPSNREWELEKRKILYDHL